MRTDEPKPCCLNCRFALSAQKILGYRSIDAMSCKKQPHRCQPIFQPCNIGRFQADEPHEIERRRDVLRRFHSQDNEMENTT